MRIRFYGAVRTVTGSLHIVETARGDTVLLDCGLFQGRRAEARVRNTSLPLDPTKVKAIVLSHAHIDHIGNLPNWAKRGLRCPIYATGATVDLTAIMLRDSANIQVLDARHINRHVRPGEPLVEPLYTPDDAERAISLLRGRNYHQWFEVVPGLRCIYHDAGHILGSASILLEETRDGVTRRLGFTGDIGRPDSPILQDPEPFPAGADVVLTESTYGDREHQPQAELPDELRKVLYQTIARGGKVLIPAFALGRTQAVMYALKGLQRAGKLPEVPVFVDSPLATKATEIFARHPECYDREAEKYHRAEGSLFDIDGFVPIRSVEESKELNVRKGPCVIIAASGMCEAGRILHHLDHSLGNPQNTVLIVGFQAEHTLGRRLVEKRDRVRVFGQERDVRAEIVVLNGFSAHAGRSEMKAYLEKARPRGPLFLVHGDEPRCQAFETFLESNGFPDVRIPTEGETYDVR
ncbi:MAG TPA: MBL fold metallo-hydrolase [Planctomycetota bacterium]|nr:MBL fold metallo-hydrolase [Planctomycetota bacterium]